MLNIYVLFPTLYMRKVSKIFILPNSKNTYKFQEAE